MLKRTWRCKVLMDTYSIIAGFPLKTIGIWVTTGLIWSYFCLRFTGYLKMKAGLRTGYTRKIFHISIFLSAAAAHAIGGFLAVCLFGTSVTLVIAYALFRGPGTNLYEAIAREQDGPHRTYYVVVPYFATLIGGLTSNLLFGPFAVFGYLVGGLGDAAGEPAGTRWGKNQYTIGRAMSTKSLEGSIAVLAASLLALLIGVAINGQLHFDLRALLMLPLIAIVCTLVEAFSPRGWDNVSMQVVPTLLVVVFMN
jgi:phytol kinase